MCFNLKLCHRVKFHVIYLFFLLFLLCPLSLESLSASFNLSGTFLERPDLLIPNMSGLSSQRSDLTLPWLFLDLRFVMESSEESLSVWWSDLEELALLCLGDDFVSSLWCDRSAFEDLSDPDLPGVPEAEELDPLSLWQNN